jgi:hypothetical protein
MRGTSVLLILAACDSGGGGGGGGGDASSGSGDGGGGAQGRVLFADDFESAGFSEWQDKGGMPDKYVITNVGSLVKSGSGALDITIRTDWSDGQLTTWFDAADEITMTMDVMFGAGWDQTNVSSRHLMQFSGNNVNVMRWGPYPDSSFGRAGETPDGTDFFWIHLTPWNDDAWHVGLAHPDQSSQWGDSMMSQTDIAPGTYQRVMFHSRMNDLGMSNGFFRLYIDGNVALERTGVEWRTSNELVFNCAGFQAYYQNFTGTGHVYVDNLEVREGAP